MDPDRLAKPRSRNHRCLRPLRSKKRMPPTTPSPPGSGSAGFSPTPLALPILQAARFHPRLVLSSIVRLSTAQAGEGSVTVSECDSPAWSREMRWKQVWA